MASAGSTLQAQALSLQQRIRTFTNNDLKEICRSEHLPVSGTKAVLQKRIGDHISTMVATGNVDDFTRMRNRVYEIAGSLPPPIPVYHTPSNTTTPNFPSTNGQVRASQLPAVASSRPAFTSRMQFKESPFASLEQLLGQPLALSATPSGKGSTSLYIVLTSEIAARVKTNPEMRIFLYAAPESSMSSYSRVDISFPQHVEVRVNGDEIRHNYKGLKNKPGSTKPADITDKVRKLEGYKNGIQVTYAYTDKKWFFEVHLVKKHTVEYLAKRIEQRGLISKERVIREMQKRADDPDLVATSSVMSLKDPISTQRISLPCRSTVCSHNGCFDATQFLYLQEQAPTWTCPLCNKAVTYEALVIDQYVQDILKNTSSSIDQVTIEPDGRWSTGVEPEAPRSNGKVPQDYDDSDDDLVEISGLAGPPIKNELLDRPSNALLASATPPLSGRTSMAPGSGTPRSGGTKRKSEVIDLTFSSDDEEPPPKRPAYSTSSAALFTNGNGASSHQSNGHAHPRPSSTTNGMPFRVPPMSHSPAQLPSINHSSGSSSSGWANSTFGWR